MSSSDRSFPTFDIDASFVGDRTVLALRGELDIHSAPDLSGYLDAMIARGHLNLELDLSDLDFLDASGLSVIAGETIRLKLSGGSLVIRDPSVQVGYLLDVTGFTKMIAVQQAPRVLDPAEQLGPEQPDDQPDSPVTNGIRELTEQLRMVTAIPSNDVVVDGALRLVVALARATVGGADGVSVSLRRHGQLATVAASDQTIIEMDAGRICHRRGAVRRCLRRGSLVPRRVLGQRGSLARLHPEGKGTRHQLHPVFAVVGPRDSRRCPQYLFPNDGCLRSEGSGAGGNIRR